MSKGIEFYLTSETTMLDKVTDLVYPCLETEMVRPYLKPLQSPDHTCNRLLRDGGHRAHRPSSTICNRLHRPPSSKQFLGEAIGKVFPGLNGPDQLKVTGER